MTETSTREPRSRRLSWTGIRDLDLFGRERLPVAILIVAAALQSVVVLRLARRSWFGVDAVYYLTTRGPVPSADEGLLKPYGGHWQTIPLLLYRAVFQVFGLHSYLPYVAMALIVHLAIVFVLYALLRSVGADRWTAFAAAWLVLFFGAGSEAFMWDAPMVLTSGLLLGLISMLVMVRQRFSLRSRLVGGVLLLAAVMCSGTGLVAAVTVGCFLLLRVGVRSALVVGAPAVVAFSVWFFSIGRDGRVSTSGSRLPEVPAYVWKGITGALGSLIGIPGTGLVLFLALAVALLWPLVQTVALRQLALAGLVGAVTQLGLSSFASLAPGTAAATVGRYQYLVLVLLSASIALAIETIRALAEQERMSPGVRAALPVIGVLLLAATTFQGFSQERRQADFGAASAQLYRTWVYGSIMAHDAGERQLTDLAGTGFNGGPFELFAQPQLRSRLPTGPSTPQTRLNAEAEYYVDVSADDPGLDQPTTISVQGLQPAALVGPGCHTLQTDGTGPATIDLHSRTGAEVTITSDSTSLTTQLFRQYLPSTQRTWYVPPGTIHVATSARQATLRVVLNGSGSFSICHR